MIMESKMNAEEGKSANDGYTNIPRQDLEGGDVFRKILVILIFGFSYATFGQVLIPMDYDDGSSESIRLSL